MFVAETVGLVLAALPLVISGLEHYGQGVRTIKRIRDYQKEFSQLKTALETEKVIFLNTLDILLKDAVDDQTANSLLASVRGNPLWSEPWLEDCLRHRLRRSFEAYFHTVNDISKSLEELRASLRLPADGKAPFKTDKLSVAQALHKLKFGLKMKIYKDLIDDIARHNSRLHRLTGQSVELTAVQTSRQKAWPDFEKAQANANAIHEVLKKRLSTSCTIYHRASLRMKPGNPEIDSPMSGSTYDCTTFRIVLHHEDEATPGVPLPWVSIETEIKLLDTNISASNASPVAQATAHVTVSQASISVPPPNAPLQGADEILDLCQKLTCLSPIHCGGHFGYLSDQITGCRNEIYWPAKPITDSTSAFALPLRDILAFQKPAFLRDVQKWQLALSLVLGLLRLYNTPWLNQHWGSREVMVFWNSKGLVVEQPFISTDVTTTSRKQSCVTQRYFQICRLIKNESIFALGVLLIEISLETPFHQLGAPEDFRPDGTKHELSDYLTADRLIDKVYEVSGDNYGDVVRRCVKCQFDPKTTVLDDAEFRRAVFGKIVPKLEHDIENMLRP